MQDQKTIEIFTKLRTIYKKLGDVYRVRAYDNAIRVLNEENSDLNQIGQHLRKKIDIIRTTGKLTELENLERYFILFDLYGFGKEFILDLIKKGITIEVPEDLYKIESIELTDMQKLGIQYYGKILKNIPHEMLTPVINKIKTELLRYVIFFEAAGSYRREKLISHDLDILIVPSNRTAIDEWIAANAVAIIVTGPAKTTFLYQLAEKMIQIDFRFISFENRVPALLYFTGSKEYNINMRSYAKSRGYKLNEYALTDEAIEMPITLENEIDCYKILMLPYLEPKYRIDLISFEVKK